MTDNGSAYVSAAWGSWCVTHKIVHLRTQPHRPRTNGKAEPFIQTMLREWAYAQSYATSEHRRRAPPRGLRHYNHTRLHGSLGHKLPISMLTAA